MTSLLEKIAAANLLVAAVLAILCLATLRGVEQAGCEAWSWQRLPVIAPIVPNTGHAFATALGTDHASSIGRPSSATVLEDGKPLPGPANALHDDIRSMGKGRYSFWGSDLLFSSSDNSNPYSNGRRYEVCWPHPLTKWAQLYVLLYLLISAALLPLAGLPRLLQVLTHHSKPRAGTGTWQKTGEWLAERNGSMAMLLALLCGAGLYGAWAISTFTELKLGAVLMTLGGVPNIANPILGWSDILNGQIVNLESTIAARQLAPMQGIAAGYNASFADNRLLYPFLTLPLLPFIDGRSALLVVNWASFVVTVLCVYLLSLDLFRHQRSALFATLLTAFSMVWASFLGNTGAHATNVAYYAIGLLLLYMLVIKPREVQRHHAAGVALAAALGGVLYTGALPLIFITALCLLFRRRPFFALLTVLAFYFLRNGQAWLITTASLGVPTGDYEVGRLAEALGKHLTMLQASPVAYAEWLLRGAVQYVGVDNPIVTILGLAGLLLFRLRGQLYLILLVAIMLGSGLAYNTIWGQKGALIFGIAPLLHVYAGRILGLLGERIHGTRTWATAALAGSGIVFVLASQILWSYSSHFGADFPTRFFFLGYSEPCLFDCRPIYADYTRPMGELPRQLGGKGNIQNLLPEMPLAVAPTPAVDPIRAKLRAAIVQSGIWLALFVCLWAFSFRLSGPGMLRAAQATIALATILIALLPHRGFDFGGYVDTFYGSGRAMQPNDRLEGRIRLSDDFITMLRQYQDKSSALDVFTRVGTYGGSQCFRLTVAGTTLAADQPGPDNRLPIAALLAAAQANERWLSYVLEFKPGPSCSRGSTAVPGWQRIGIDIGREAWLVRGNGERIALPRFPVLELRLPSTQGQKAYSVIGF